MKTFMLSIFAALSLAACAGTSATAGAPSPAPARAPAAAPVSDSFGSVDGVPIKRADLDPEVLTRLTDLENEAEQRQLHLLWAGVEEVISRRLLAKEAARRGITAEVLREQEVFSKVTQPTEAEIQQFYDANADAIGVPYSAAAPHIKNELMGERITAQERAFVDQLRKGVDVEYALPAPELPRRTVDAGKGPSWGETGAKVTVVEFSDFQCPYCGRASVMLQKLKELYPKGLRVEFRHFPLAQHPQARAAAEAAVCADEQGTFWPFHDLLFANAGALGPDDLKRYAETAKLDAAAFASCLASERPAAAIEASLAAGKRLGVEGTPAIYINGIKLIGLLPLPVMQALVDGELAR